MRVATNGPVKEYTLSGIFTTEDGAVNAGGSLVLFDTEVAQKLYLEPGEFSDVTVAATAGTSDQKLLDAVKPSSRRAPRPRRARTSRTRRRR